MKLSDIAIAVANNPNALWKLNNHSGYFKVVGFTERASNGYSSKKRIKVIQFAQVSVRKAISAGDTDIFGNPMEPREESLHMYDAGNYLPSQVVEPADIWFLGDDNKVTEKVALTTDNLIETTKRKDAEIGERNNQYKLELNRQVDLLQKLVGDDFQVVTKHITDKWYSQSLIKAIINKLEKENQ